MPRCAKPTSAPQQHEAVSPLSPLFRGERVRVRVRGEGQGLALRYVAAPHPDPLPMKNGEREKTEVSMLEVADVATAYGKIEALKGVTLSAERGRITCLLGPNGAGNRVHERGLAGAVGAKKAGDAPPRGRERDALQRLDLAVSRSNVGDL